MDRCCACCKNSKKNPKKNSSGNPVQPKFSRAASVVASASVSDHNVIEAFQMSPEHLEAHYKDLKNMYSYAIETMKNYLGKPCYPYITERKQLYPYILFLCEGLEAHEYVAIKEMVSENKALTIQLTVMIKDAKVIHPKLTDFSRIFCKLWIRSDDELLTSVKESTSYLLWDETFVFGIEDYESDIVHIEIWSFRPGLLEKIASYTSESFKEDDPLAEEKGMYFIGDAFEYVKALPCVCRTLMWTLKKGPRRVYTKGQLNVYIHLGGIRSPDFLLHVYCHMAFIRLCYEKKISTEEESHNLWKNWLEILPNTALTLIQQHAIQNGMMPIEQCLCSWLVTSSLKMRHEDRISFNLLRDLLGHLLTNICEAEIGPMKEMLTKSISDFSMYVLDMLRHLHLNFDVLNIEMADELFYMLRCMSIAELKLCTNYMDSYEVIQEESSEWYLIIIKDLKKDLQADESVEKMSDVLKNIMKTYLKNQIILDDIFTRAWNVSYSSITYKKLDEVVCTTIQPMTKHLMVMVEDSHRKRRTPESLKLLQLYHSVRNLVNYILNCFPSQRAVIRMGDYSNWFGEELVLEWFLLCDLYTRPFIQRAVLADSMDKLSPEIVHGTSVPDVAAVIDEIVIDVWMKLKWKDQFYTHGALLEAVKSCVVYYCESILERVELEKYFCFDEFDITNKLCVALSNVYAMAEHLHKTNKKIKREMKVAELALGFKLSQPLVTMEGHTLIMTSKIFLIVFKKVRNRIQKLIKRSIKGKAEITNHGSADLCLYIDNTLEMMYSNLKREAFYICLRYMWIVLLKSLNSGLNYAKGCFVTKKQKLNIYMVLLQTLNQMKTIFFCEGHGLTQYEMENALCEELKCTIEARLK